MEQQNLDSQIQKIFSQFNNKEYQIVINQCVNLINLNHKVPVIYNLLGTSLLFIQEYKKALKFYNLGKELDPNNEELLRNIGKCYLSLKNYADAEISFKKALKKTAKLEEVLAPDIMLKLYAYYKQAVVGDSFSYDRETDVIDAFKFNAWRQLNGMSQEEAKKQYIKLANSI